MFTLDQVVPWGRSFSEYRRMCALSDADLESRILGCAGGPASVNAEEVKRKIIVYIATSADGYIARPDGDVDWLNRRTGVDYGMGAFYRSIDMILWGRNTYDFAMKLGAALDPKVKNYVFSHRPPRLVAAPAEFVRTPICTFAKQLRATPGKDVWVMEARV
jgi:hypothetical protein